jgi:hypothetical protein
MSARLAHIVQLLAEDSQLNVYAGELEGSPPAAPIPTGRSLVRTYLRPGRFDR